MNFNKNPLTLLKEWLSKENAHSPPKDKKGKKYQYFLIVLLIGVAFMLISDLWSNGDSTAEVTKNLEESPGENVPAFGSKQKETDQTMRGYEDQYENQLKEALDQIVGVSDVLVIVNVEATESKVYEKDESSQSQLTDEADKEGGKRSIEEKSKDEKMVIIRRGR